MRAGNTAPPPQPKPPSSQSKFCERRVQGGNAIHARIARRVHAIPEIMRTRRPVTTGFYPQAYGGKI